MHEGIVQKAQHIHCIGIGGIGVSALARMLVAQGKKVSGSDVSQSVLTEALESEGISIMTGHRVSSHLGDSDVVVYSPAIPNDNPELVFAREQSIPTLSYPQALGEISKHTFTIAVAGTHGKTTTTAMLAGVLRETINPTVIVGSLLKGSQSNFIAGSKDYFLVEACEYKRSFTNLSPDILVITNIEEDHLDYYKNLDDIQRAFNDVVRKVPADGYVVCDIEDDNIKPALNGVQATVRNYRAFLSHDVKLQVPGEHNRKNAAVAHAVGDIFGIEDAEIHQALHTFTGTWRRFEYKGEIANGALLYDDYAHNPTEVKATLEAMKEKYPEKKIIAVFQPHLYSRTKYFLGDFPESFREAEKVIVAPIYAAREIDDGTITHHDLVKALQRERIDAIGRDSFEDIEKHLSEVLIGDEVVVTIGAGDIYTVGEELLK